MNNKYSKLKAPNRASDDVVEKKRASSLALATAKQCEKEKQRLNVLQNNTDIRMSNGDGTSFLLTKDQIKSEIERTERYISIYCDKT